MISTDAGEMEWFPLIGNSVASFYEQTMTLLKGLGIAVVIERPVPYGLTDTTPFESEVNHNHYDPFWINRCWRILSAVNLMLEEFAGDFSGKTSPVHLFWHSMDIAVTRFSDREVDQPQSVDSVNREAYSREVISSGFWFGDAIFPEPAFYSYTSPEPEGPSARSGSREGRATWRCIATTTPEPPPTRNHRYWCSSKAPTKPGPPARAGTSIGSRRLTARP